MSSCFIRILTADGLLPVDYSADSLGDAVQYEPQDGVYTVTNTYNTFQILKLDAHLNRLEDSVLRENIQLKLDRSNLRAALRRMITESGYGNVRFRVTVPRDTPDHFIISVEPFTPPSPEIITHGVSCITASDSARNNPAAKTTDWMHARRSLSDEMLEGIYDTFLLSADGYILEGLSSNFYAVLEGELWTAGEGVLPGIARQVVFTVAPDVLPLRKEAVHVDDLPRLNEAFLTSSSRGIIPVVEINGVMIGEGVPGPKTLELRKVYGAWVEAHLEDL